MWAYWNGETRLLEEISICILITKNYDWNSTEENDEEPAVKNLQEMRMNDMGSVDDCHRER